MSNLKIYAFSFYYFVVFAGLLSSILLANASSLAVFVGLPIEMIYYFNLIVVYFILSMQFRYITVSEHEIVVSYPLRFFIRKRTIAIDKIVKIKIVVTPFAPISMRLKISSRYFPYWFTFSIFVDRNKLNHIIEFLKTRNQHINVDGKSNM